MYNLSGNDSYYDPPDEPTFSECDMCGCVHDNDDLTHIKNNGEDLWLCQDCEENYWLRISIELEEQEAIEMDLEDNYSSSNQTLIPPID